MILLFIHIGCNIPFLHYSRLPFILLPGSMLTLPHVPTVSFGSVPRGERLPEEGAAVLHPVHGRAVLVYGHPGAAHTPVPRADGHRRQNGQPRPRPGTRDCDRDPWQ